MWLDGHFASLYFLLYISNRFLFKYGTLFSFYVKVYYNEKMDVLSKKKRNNGNTFFSNIEQTIKCSASLNYQTPERYEENQNARVSSKMR